MKKKIAEILNEGGVGVLPTDTIYGIVGRALDKKVVERIYKLKKRRPKKPFIILIAGLGDLRLFGIKLGSKEKKFLRKVWPWKVSVVLPCHGRKFAYLHRGTGNLAIRLPSKVGLVKLLRKTGPLAAPSANPEGLPPAKTIKEARKYFGARVDFYEDAGKLDSEPSTLVKFSRGKPVVLRRGAVHLEA